VGEIEGTRSRDHRHDPAPAEIEGEVARGELRQVRLELTERCLEGFWPQDAVSRQANQVAIGLECSAYLAILLGEAGSSALVRELAGGELLASSLLRPARSRSAIWTAAWSEK
jgi:hypothetical protein